MTHEEIVKKVVDALEKNGVSYMLTGAFAVNYYGKARLTHDIDLVVQISLDDAHKVVSLFQDEFYVALEGIIDAVKHGTMFNLIHPETGIKIGCWMLKTEEYSQVSFSHRRKETVFDQEMYISSPEDLIITKLDCTKNLRPKSTTRMSWGYLKCNQESLISTTLKSGQSTFLSWILLKIFLRKFENEAGLGSKNNQGFGCFEIVRG